jgi:hypothetical protein
MSLRCWRDACGHDLHDHRPDPPHQCEAIVAGGCACRGFQHFTSYVKPDPDPEPDRDLVLQEAARHLAGLGRGKFHRVDASFGPSGQAGIVKLDGVELRGVQEVEIESSVSGPTRMKITMIVSLNQDSEPRSS